MKCDFFISNFPAPSGCLLYKKHQSQFKSICSSIPYFSESAKPYLILVTSHDSNGSCCIVLCQNQLFWRDQHLNNAGSINYQNILGADVAEHAGRLVLRIITDCCSGPFPTECLSFDDKDAADTVAEFFIRWSYALRKGCVVEDAISEEVYFNKPAEGALSDAPLPWVTPQPPKIKPAPSVNIAEWFKSYGEAHPEYQKFIFAFLSDHEKEKALKPFKSFFSTSAWDWHFETGHILAVFPGKPGLAITQKVAYNNTCDFLFVPCSAGLFSPFGTKPAKTSPYCYSLSLGKFSPADKNHIAFNSDGNLEHQAFYLHDRDMAMQLIRALTYDCCRNTLDGVDAAIEKQRRYWPAFRDFMDNATPPDDKMSELILKIMSAKMEIHAISDGLRYAASLAKGEHRTPLDILDSPAISDMRLDTAHYGMDICKASFFEEINLYGIWSLVERVGGKYHKDYVPLWVGLTKSTAPELFEGASISMKLSFVWFADPANSKTCDLLAYGNHKYVLRLNKKCYVFPDNAYSGFVLDENNHLIALKAKSWGYEDTGITLSGNLQLILPALSFKVSLPREPIADYSDLDNSTLYHTEKSNKSSIDMTVPFFNFKPYRVVLQDLDSSMLWLHPSFYVDKCAVLQNQQEYGTTDVLARDYLGRYWTVSRDSMYNMFCALQATPCSFVFRGNEGHSSCILYPLTMMYRSASENTRRGRQFLDSKHKK